MARSRPRLGAEEPRIWTKPLRELTPETSLGFAVIEFARVVLGIELYPWQKWLLIHALELLPDGQFRFRNVVVLVARQNGKSTLSQVLALFFMYVLGTALVIGTAQDLDVAEEIWEGAVEIVEETPELNAQKERVVRVNGKKSLELKTKERYKVKAANRRAGRGLSGDLVLLDELREHQSWDAWGAITKTTMARPEAQVWALSNAGDATSIVLRYLRKMAHEALGDPDGINRQDDPSNLLAGEEDAEELEVLEDDDTLGIFEWSAPPGCDVNDRDGWAQANPSLGHGGITERTIASAAKTDPEWVFRTEVLCQWSDGTLEGPFPAGSWDGCKVDKSKVADGERIVLALDVTWDRSRSHVAIAGHRDDGMPHIGIIASRPGTSWVASWLDSDEAPPFDTLVVQGRGCAAADLIDELEGAGIDVTRWQGQDLSTGTGNFYNTVKAGGLRHLGQPVLDLAAATTVPKLTDGGSFIWDRRKSPADASPLVAVTAALWGLSSKSTPVRSAYEDHDLIVI